MNFGLLKKGDWWGIATMAIGLASLEIVLEDGNRKDWFGDPGVVRLAWIAALAIIGFVVIELRSKDPLVDLKLFGRRNFALGSIINIVLGSGLYGFVFILPQYLGLIHGYNALEIGKVIIWMGIPQLAVIPLIPMLMKRIDARLIVAAGVLLFGASTLFTSHLSMSFAGEQFHIPLIVRALGQPMILIPISSIATEGMEKGRESGAASALFNMMRNIGGSVGIAGLSTLLSVRERFHSLRLGESVSVYAQATQDRLSQTAGYFMSRGSGEYSASVKAIGALAGIIRRESFLLSFSDCFFALSLVLLASLLPLFFMKKPHVTGGGAAH
jgi:DHA2 family multidrug resistance protein